MIDNYLKSSKLQFQYYKQLGEKTFDQLTDQQLFYKENEELNSIANIVFHLYGNMMSRWTDFLVSDGEKSFRNRDQEFEDILGSREELLKRWEEGWSCLFTALDSIKAEHTDQLVYIRNIGHSIVEAINRQLCHYAYHIGQIVLIGKTIKKSNWKSLSIPRGKSVEYNKSKFEKEKHRGHFTNEFLDKS